MCGISGYILNPNELPEKQHIEKMTDHLKSRGPDAGAVWMKDRFALGHRRLKIIDLSDSANQPMLNSAQDVAIVFNGEIYNFKILREELKKLGRQFRTSSDTEVLLQSYEQWGADAFKKLNGMFAFAVIDFRNSKPVFYLVRDRWGIKPLYYSWQKGRLAFASTPGALLALPWIKKDIDQNAIAHYLRFAHFPQIESIYVEIKQVLPGTYFKWQNENLTQERYFHPTEIITNSPSDPTQIDKVLRNAVERQMVSDTEVGCFLSGGIDSGLLVSYASKIQPKLKTFSLGYSETEFDETPHAEKMAQYFGTKHFSFKIGPEDLQKRAYELPHFFDQPLGDPTILPTLFLAEYTCREVKVALSGDGGDELFCGYPHQAALIKLNFFSSIPLSIRNSLTPKILGKVSTLMQFETKAEWIENFIGILGPLERFELENVLQKNLSSRGIVQALLDEKQMINLTWPQQVEQVYLRTFMSDTVLTKADRAGMAYGLEARVPFLDDEVTQFAGSLPLQYKLDGLKSKAILRNLLKEKLPGNLHQRKKQGFSIPLRDWYKGAWKTWLASTLDEKKLQSQGIFSGPAVAQLIKEHHGGKINHSHLLWCLMSFQLWYEQQN